jgi:hypothetical protein
MLLLWKIVQMHARLQPRSRRAIIIIYAALSWTIFISRTGKGCFHSYRPRLPLRKKLVRSARSLAVADRQSLL